MRTDLTPQLPTEELIHRVFGELDVASVGALREELRLTMAAGSGPVVLDLAAVTFVDAAGLGALVWFAYEMRARGRRASVHGAGPMASRLLEMTHVGRLFAARPAVPSW